MNTGILKNILQSKSTAKTSAKISKKFDLNGLKPTVLSRFYMSNRNEAKFAQLS